MSHFYIYVNQMFVKLSFKQAAGRMPAACPCNHMFTAGINRNHNNRTSLPPCVNCLLLVSLSLRDGMFARIIPSHDTLSYLYIMSDFLFYGLRTRMPADRSCNRMFTAGISWNHDNRTSLPPSLIVCYSYRSLFGTGCP